MYVVIRIHNYMHNPNPIERNSYSVRPSGTFFTHLPSHTTKHGLSARRDMVDNKVDDMMDDMVDNMVAKKSHLPRK